MAAPFPLIKRNLRQVFELGKGFVAKAGEGRYHGHIQLKGVNRNILGVKVSGKDTDGALAVFEQTSLTPKRGVPLHVHPHQDEIFHILEGTTIFRWRRKTRT